MGRVDFLHIIFFIICIECGEILAFQTSLEIRNLCAHTRACTCTCIAVLE